MKLLFENWRQYLNEAEDPDAFVAGDRVVGRNDPSRRGEVLDVPPKVHGSGRRARVIVYVAWDGDYFIHPQPDGDQREKKWTPADQLRREDISETPI